MFDSVLLGKSRPSLHIATYHSRLLTRIYRKAKGHSVDELPFKAAFGIWGSIICAIMNLLCLVASFYTALYPVGGPYLDPTLFFQAYLAGPFIVFLYFVWKIYSWFYVKEHRQLWIPIKDIDIYTGMREGQSELISGENVSPDQRRASILEMQEESKKKGAMDYAKAVVRSVF
jgi:yeast amino acid transporter